MAHHVSETDAARPGITALTVQHEGHQRTRRLDRADEEVRFSRGPRNRGGIVVRLGHKRAYVVGEDLSALRVFLDELPAEEFPPFAETLPPAPPAPWVAGDVVICVPPGEVQPMSVYTRLADRWVRVATSALHLGGIEDEYQDWSMDEMVARKDVYRTIRRGGKAMS